MGVVLVSGILAAHFLPEKGMNLISFKKGDVEVIDQNTWPLFEERYAGLGAMIGPHFHQRAPESIPPWPDEMLFPHLKKLKAKGAKDPFSHGIGRYAPWRVVSQTDSTLVAELSGEDRWQGISLKELEGQDFKMSYTAKLSEIGLSIELAVQSEHVSLVGLHTYYALDQGCGQVVSCVQEEYNDMGVFRPIPATWNYQQHRLELELPQAIDYGFLPYPDPLHADVLLTTASHQVRVQSWAKQQEHAWQIWQPEGGTFVCIEPLSAKNPRHCVATSSRIKILISIL